MRMLFGILFLLLLSIAGTAHANSYTDNGNGTITDNTTGLIWQKATVPGNWTSASSYCSSLNLSGYSDWRLPTVCELTTLVNTTYTPTINPTYFPNTATACYWSSTADVYGPEYAWYVNFYGGFDGDSNKSNDYYFRAVRGGQSGSLGNSVISISPLTQNVIYGNGTTAFSVSSTGVCSASSGGVVASIPWTAAVTSGNSWLSIITSGLSGSNNGTISCSYTANASTSSRTGTIQVTASDAVDSPVNLTITQASPPVPVPDTGQTTCYDDQGNVLNPCPSPGQPLYGQDANYTINPLSYTKLDSNGNVLQDSATSWAMIKDNVTGLMWENKTGVVGGAANYSDPHNTNNTYTWYDSNPATNGGDPGYSLGDGTDTESFINSLNSAHLGGYSDWRLPTVNELTNILQFSIPISGPSIQTAYFPNTRENAYWSSTSIGNTGWAGYVNFDVGRTVCADAKYPSFHYVRAVRGGQGASGYTINLNGLVTDASTGLMWQGGKSGNTMTWEDALSYCENLNLGGFTDWRLPNIKELLSLVDYNRTDPSINTTYFPDTQQSNYWSSTTGLSEYGRATSWYVEFEAGCGDTDANNDTWYVRAVRGGNPVLSVSPTSQNVGYGASTTTFSVSNTGPGTMPWTAAVISGSSWLSIITGSRGTDSATISCSFSANSGTSSRSGTIQVTASGAVGSPVNVTVTQAAATPIHLPTPTPTPTPTPIPIHLPCIANLNENLALHVPYISYQETLPAGLSTVTFSADFTYDPDPNYPLLIIFKYVTLNMITNPSFSCAAATLSSTLVLHVPDVVFPDGVTHVWADLTYSPDIAADGNLYFVVTNYGNL